MANEGTPMESFTVTNPRDGVRLHALRWGHGPRVILAVHGLNAHGWHWRRNAERLGPEYTLVSYDLRGHGESDKPDDGYTFDDQGGDIDTILAHVGADPGEIAVMGHSLGARIAMPYVVRHPGRGFVIVDPGIVTHAERAERSAAPPVEGARRRPALQMEYDSRDQFIERMGRTNFMRNWHEYNQEYAARLIGPPEADGRVRLNLTPNAHVKTMGAINDADMSEYFAEIACPTLIIRATEGHLQQPMAERMHAEIPGSELVVIEDCNHNVMLDRPDEFDAAFDPFLARIFP